MYVTYYHRFYWVKRSWIINIMNYELSWIIIERSWIIIDFLMAFLTWNVHLIYVNFTWQINFKCFLSSSDSKFKSEDFVVILIPS